MVLHSIQQGHTSMYKAELVVLACPLLSLPQPCHQIKVKTQQEGRIISIILQVSAFKSLLRQGNKDLLLMELLELQ